MFIKLPDQAIQNIYDYDVININPICDKIRENNLKRRQKEKLMTEIKSLYSNDTDIQKTIQNCDFEFLDRALDYNVSLFMTNYLFGDSVKKVAIKQTVAAEKSLNKCFDNTELEQQNEKPSTPGSTGSRKSSRKSKRPK